MRQRFPYRWAAAYATTNPLRRPTRATRYGPDRLVAALDVRAGSEPEVLTRGWVRESGRSLWELLDLLLDQGYRWFLCTDVDRDGMLSGPNTDLYAECVQRAPGASFIASGGVSGADDLRALADTGVAAAVSGKALLEGRISAGEAEQCWRGG